MSTYVRPSKPAGPPPMHARPQPGFLIYDDGDGLLWCSRGLLVATTSPAAVISVPAAALNWRANLQTGVAYLQIATDVDGVPTGATVGAAAALPADTRHRLEFTSGPSDYGTAGAYHLPLANLAPGVVDPVLSGSSVIPWSPPPPDTGTTVPP